MLPSAHIFFECCCEIGDVSALDGGDGKTGRRQAARKECQPKRSPAEHAATCLTSGSHKNGSSPSRRSRSFFAHSNGEVPVGCVPRRLERALTVFIDHYNGWRPHRSLGLAPPNGLPSPARWNGTQMTLKRRDRLGGLLHEYARAA
jgi:hypothetical protein